jgi:hypothetical protein
MPIMRKTFYAYWSHLLPAQKQELAAKADISYNYLCRIAGEKIGPEPRTFAKLIQADPRFENKTIRFFCPALFE